jgi:hypothetical protein
MASAPRQPMCSTPLRAGTTRWAPPAVLSRATVGWTPHSGSPDLKPPRLAGVVRLALAPVAGVVGVGDHGDEAVGGRAGGLVHPAGPARARGQVVGVEPRAQLAKIGEPVAQPLGDQPPVCLGVAEEDPRLGHHPEGRPTRRPRRHGHLRRAEPA